MQNASIGMLHYLDNLAEFGEEDLGMDGETGFVEQLARLSGSFAVYDGITSGRMYGNKDDFLKFNGEQHRTPRSVKNYKDDYGRGIIKGKTTQDFIDQIRNYLTYLEPEFFDFLFNRAYKEGNEGVKRIVKRMQTKYQNENIFGETQNPPTTVDQLFDRTQEFMLQVLKTEQGREAMEKMRGTINQEHRVMEKEMFHNNKQFRTVRQRLADAEKNDLSAFNLKTRTKFSGADDSPIDMQATSNNDNFDTP